MTYPATIAAPVAAELVVKKSRFLTHVHPVASTQEADEVIASLKKQFWDARHNCVAMVTGLHGEHARSSDDGEPSGTAGMPMLDVLRRRELTDVVAVVTRYFGGVLLGAGGLIRAYSTAVSEALDTAQLVHRMALTQALVSVTHADAGRIDNFLRTWAIEHGATLGEPSYAVTAIFELWVPADAKDPLVFDLAAISAGALAPEFGNERIVGVPA